MRRLVRRAGSQAGFTLVDTLVGVAILGIGVTAVVSGMATSIKVSDVGRSSAEAQLAVRAYAEALAATSYADCAASYATGYSAPAGYTAGLTVAYWNAGSSSFGSTCGTDSGLQRVTLTVTSADLRATEVLMVAKRKRPAGEP